jgi:hypothetical protein
MDRMRWTMMLLMLMMVPGWAHHHDRTRRFASCIAANHPNLLIFPVQLLILLVILRYGYDTTRP